MAEDIRNSPTNHPKELKGKENEQWANKVAETAGKRHHKVPVLTYYIKYYE